MIQSFQVINENQDAYTDHVSKKTGLVRIKKRCYPEGMAKVQNIEELLNGIKDFTEDKRKLTEHEVLYQNLWKMWQQIWTKTPVMKIVLMTIHLAKGLEFHMFSCVGGRRFVL
jgi:DNA helicase-2/ATP-dependent DNA helicase PcrA